MEFATGDSGPLRRCHGRRRDQCDDPAARRLVAIAYGPRSVAAIQIAEAAAEVCDLLWLVDARAPEIEEMGPLLRRFGAVVDIGGLQPRGRSRAGARLRAGRIVTYFDADMVAVAEMAAVARACRSSRRTRRSCSSTSSASATRSRAAGLEVPGYWAIPSGPSDDALAAVPADASWPAVLKPRSETGSHNTFLAARPRRGPDAAREPRRRRARR